MDPNGVRSEIMALARQILEAGNDGTSTNSAALAEAILQLDYWIRSGGFLPQMWQKRTI